MRCFKEFISKMEAAHDAKEYNFAVKRDDGARPRHACLHNRPGELEIRLERLRPVDISWIETSPVVTGFIDEKIAKEAGDRAGRRDPENRRRRSRNSGRLVVKMCSHIYSPSHRSLKWLSTLVIGSEKIECIATYGCNHNGDEKMSNSGRLNQKPTLSGIKQSPKS